VTGRLDATDPKAGMGYELDSIAAVVIGGTSLSGGRGSILGTVLGLPDHWRAQQRPVPA